MKKLLWIIIVLLLIALIFIIKKNAQLQEQRQPYIDTITVYDTVQYIAPHPKDSNLIGAVIRKLPITKKNKKLAKDSVDTLIIAQPNSSISDFDSVPFPSDDSALVEIPITQTIYGDSTYKAYISGYNAKLDSFYIYPQTKIVTRYIEPKNKRWALSVQAGVGLHGPYIGIGISYNLLYLGK